MSLQGNIVIDFPPLPAGAVPTFPAPAISFDVGDVGDGFPINGQTSLEVATLGGIPIANKQLLVVREGIALRYSGAAVKDIRRFNSGGLGGFVFEPASGLSFVTGEHYDIYIVGVDFTVQT